MPVEANAKSIFLAALDQPTPAERAAYLDAACGGDGELRRRVEALLHAHDRPDPLLDQPAVPNVARHGDTALDFLEPSTKPGSLGRLGHYEVLELIGRGGMGVVLRALDEKLHRVVAIKALAPALAVSGEARQRFVREARAAAAVTHDNVIAIHAVEDAGPVPYIVMQCIDGKTLQEKLDRAGPLGLKETLRIGLQIAEGLAAAHRQGLIHRDIKPANILMENGVERVKIIDFGLARAVDDASLTQSGMITGTPLYVSPEQARGEPVDHRSDLFSLGSVLYTLGAGHPPFQAETTIAVLKRVCEETPRPLNEINPNIPDWLQALIANLQAKNPAERYSSAKEVAALLSRCLAQLQTGSGTVDIGPMPKSLKPRSIRNLVGATVLVVAASIAAWLIYQSWSGNGQGTQSGGPNAATGGPNAATGGPNAATAGPAKPVVVKKNLKLMRHSRSVRTLAFSPDGKVLASGGLEGNIFLWDTKTWQPRGPLKGHPGDITCFSFTADSTRLASVTTVVDICLIRVWNVATSEEVEKVVTAKESIWAVAYSPDGKTLACGGNDKALHIIDVATGVQRHLIPNVAPRLLRALSFSPDSKQIATGGSGATLLWDAATGEEIPLDERLPEEMCPTILPDGKGLVGWIFREGRVTICDLPSGHMRASWPAHPNTTIEGLAVSTDGRFLASIGGDGVARVWSTADQTEVATLIGHNGTIHSVAFTPDGAQLATGGADDLSIRIWDLPEICRTAK
jgi:eukaryotic-like serine/threonine-protein kinase